MSKPILGKQDYIPADDWIPVMLEMLERGNKMQLSPRGYSMYPFLRSDQDEVILTQIMKPLKRGDVVLYRRDNALHVLHRIHHINKQGYYMLGDSQSEIEGPLRRNQILAIMEAFKRGDNITYVTNQKYRLLAWMWIRMRLLRKPIISMFHWLRKVTRTEHKKYNA